MPLLTGMPPLSRHHRRALRLPRPSELVSVWDRREEWLSWQRGCLREVPPPEEPTAFDVDESGNPSGAAAADLGTAVHTPVPVTPPMAPAAHPWEYLVNPWNSESAVDAGTLEDLLRAIRGASRDAPTTGGRDVVGAQVELRFDEPRPGMIGFD